jgi:hypothetical protein
VERAVIALVVSLAAVAPVHADGTAATRRPAGRGRVVGGNRVHRLRPARIPLTTTIERSSDVALLKGTDSKQVEEKL